jgi:bifunctional DNase/RNase
MTCGQAGCESDASVHLTFATGGSLEAYQYVCERHATGLVASTLPGSRSKISSLDDRHGDLLFELRLILYDEKALRSEIYLGQVGGDRLLKIGSGPWEAMVLDCLVKGTKPKRPLTHETICNLMAMLGGKLDHVVIDEYRRVEDIFLSKLVMEQNGRRLLLDVRPSDAVAIALGSKAPIFVSRQLLKEVG